MRATALQVACIAAALALFVAVQDHRRGAGPATLRVSTTGALRSAAGARTTILDADDLVPGQRRTGSVSVRSGGPAIPGLRLRGSVRDHVGPRGGRLSDVLVVEISELSRDARPRRVWVGTARALPDLALGPVDAKHQRTFGVAVTLPASADDEVQGSAVAFDLHWEASEAR